MPRCGAPGRWTNRHSGTVSLVSRSLDLSVAYFAFSHVMRLRLVERRRSIPPIVILRRRSRRRIWAGGRCYGLHATRPKTVTIAHARTSPPRSQRSQRETSCGWVGEKDRSRRHVACSTLSPSREEPSEEPHRGDRSVRRGKSSTRMTLENGRNPRANSHVLTSG